MFEELKLSDLKDKLGSSAIDVFICAASFEERCKSIADNLDHDLVSKAIIFKNVDFDQFNSRNVAYLASLFGAKGVVKNVNTKNPLLTADAMKSSLLEAGPENRRYLVDITTFTHEGLLILLKVLSQSITRGQTVRFLYNAAKDYSIGDPDEEKWLSRGILEIRSVLGYAGSMMPSRPLHLIVLVGFESERAAQVIDRYEPSKLSLGLVPEDQTTAPGHFSRNYIFWQKLNSAYENSNSFSFSGIDPIATLQELKNQVSLARDHNIIVAPMNTKISTLGAALLAFENQDVQICYAPADIYNYYHYSSPKDTCHLITLPALFGG